MGVASPFVPVRPVGDAPRKFAANGAFRALQGAQDSPSSESAGGHAPNVARLRFR